MVHVATGSETFEVPAWLPADTEESVLGTEWHQEAIGAAASMIEEVGRRRGATWGVGRTLSLLEAGGRYPDWRPYDPMPEIVVLPRPLPSGAVAGVSVHECGIPLLIVEVASRSTVANDVGSKRALYEFVGVAEYIVFDAAGGVLSPPLRAWRAVDGRYVRWLAGPDSWWHSRALDITLRPTQPFMSIRDRDGREISTPRRALEREEQLEQELAEARRRIAAMEAEQQRRRGR